MHLSDTDLGAALDPAGGGVAGSAARAHAATCGACSTALREARVADDEVAELLELLDHRSPTVDYRALEWRVVEVEQARQAERTEEYPALSPGTRRLVSAPRGGSGRTVSLAARRGIMMLALSAAAAAAAVAPHSPVRALVARVATRSRAAAPAPRPVVLPETPSATAPVTPRGVAIASAQHVDLVFRAPSPGGAVHIRETKAASVSVMASAAGPVYTVGAGAILVDPRGTPGVTYDVELPPPDQVRSVSIRIGSRVVFARRGPVVRSDSRPAPDGSYLIPLDG